MVSSFEDFSLKGFPSVTKEGSYCIHDEGGENKNLNRGDKNDPDGESICITLLMAREELTTLPNNSTTMKGKEI